ncbi:MAG TPA: cupredoxin family copper-binding protein [Sphingomicrobium sp.]
MNRAFGMVTFQAFALLFTAFAMTIVADEVRGAPPSPTVHIGNFTFNQAAIAVHPGTTVTWVNDDDIPHTIVATGGAFRSKVLDTGDRFSFTFAKAGQFDYFCSLHPHMTGRVIVKV